METRQVRGMGTTIDLMLEHEAATDLLELAARRLGEYERRFSANDATSELMAINLNAGIKAVTPDPQLFQLIKLGKVHSLADPSHLDIAIGPLIQTWRIGFEDARVPTAAEIQRLLTLIDPAQIQLDEAQGSVYLPERGMALDLGSLAKGYSADLLATELAAAGVQQGLLNLGGNVLTIGASPHGDGLWRIGIRDPLGGPQDFALLVKVGQKSVVTSGIYERSLTQQGRTYHHIFDPKTGYPQKTAAASLTIISDRSVDGEIWTTRLFGYDPETIMATIDTVPEIEGLLLMQDGRRYFSGGMTEYLDRKQDE